MTTRVKWDEYETAILIDAFWKIENKIAPKKDVIEDTSKLLRRRANNLNIEIDDTFRNENGISMQLSSIAHGFFPDRHSLTSSKTFERVVSLYIEDKNAYNALLAEAIKQSKGELDMIESENNKQLFVKWLAEKSNSKISAELAVNTLDSASEYGVMHHAFKKDLWHINDTKEFTDAISRLLGMRLFRLMHKQTATELQKIVPVYKSFLSEKNISNVVPEKVASIERTDAIYLIDLYYLNDREKISIEEVSKTLRKRAIKLEKNISDEYMNQAAIEKYFSEIDAVASSVSDTNSNSLIAQLIDLRQNNYFQYKLQSDMVKEQLSKLGLYDNEPIISEGESDLLPAEGGNIPTEFAKTDTVSESIEPDYNDATYLSDIVFKFLKKESERNQYGTTIQYIVSHVKAPDVKVKKILDSSEWATVKYGRYFFVSIADGNQKYDFASPKSLSFTKPISISYFGDIISEASSWRKLYVDFMKVIYEDYPHVIDEIAGRITTGSSVPLVIRIEDLSLAKVPGQFANGLYVEMNRSANDIMQNIKKILDLCNVDYENIEVEYARKQDADTSDANKNSKKVSSPDNHVELNILDKESDAEEKNKDVSIDYYEIVDTIQSHYAFGFNINSPIELIKFRNYFAQKNIECKLNDADLTSAIRQCGFEFNGKIYILEKETQEKLLSEVESFYEKGISIIYYDDYYTVNEDWLYDGKVLSSEMMKAFLEQSIKNYQFKSNFILTSSTKMTELEALKKDLIRVWGTQILRTFSELKELLPFVPMDKIKYALSYGELFTWNSFETYSRNDYFTISDEQIERLVIAATEKCTENGNTSFDELPLEDIVAENYELSESALFDTVFKFLSDKFERNNRVIVMKGDKIDTTSAIIKYCSGKESCTMSELETVMQDVSGELRYPVVIEAAHLAMTRVGVDSFVSDDHVLFDVQAVDSTLDSIVKGNGIGMLEVTTFGMFPFCGYSWNHFVLESFCRKYSEKYKYVCITPNSKNAGAIVKKSCGLEYHDLMAEAVARSDVEIDEKAVYDFLVSTGYMIKRQYNNMKDLLEKANLLRKGAN